MSELALSRDERLALRARAHHLNPVVLLGIAGLTEAVIKETDRALAAHELIKVRIPGDDREEREAIGMQLAERLGAARVQSIGKLLVLYRPKPEVSGGPIDSAKLEKPRTSAARRPPKRGDVKANRPGAGAGSAKRSPARRGSLRHR